MQYLCRVKGKYARTRAAKHILQNIDKAKLLVCLLGTKDNDETKCFESITQRTVGFLRKLLRINFNIYLLTLIRTALIENQKFLFGWKAECKEKHITKVIKEKDSNNIDAVFKLSISTIGPYEELRYNCYQNINFFIDNAIISLNLIERLFKETKNFILMEPNNVETAMKIINYLKKEGYRFIEIPYKVRIGYLLEGSLYEYCPYEYCSPSIAIVFKSNSSLLRVYSSSLVSYEIEELHKYLADQENKIKKADDEFETTFSQNRLFYVHLFIETSHKLLLFYFENEDFDLPLEIRYPVLKWDVRDVGYIHDNNAFSRIIMSLLNVLKPSDNKCRKIEKIFKHQNVELHVVREMYYVVHNISISFRFLKTAETLFKTQINFDSHTNFIELVQVSLSNSIFSLTSNDINEIRESFIEFFKAFEIISSECEFSFLEKAIRYKEVDIMLLH